MNRDPKNPLSGIDVDAIIKATIRKEWPVVSPMPKASPKMTEALDESYVAEPKPYKQVSETVSQRAKDAHIKLYQEYIETLNKVSAELDTADRGEANSKGSEFKSLKVDETMNLNAVYLHELFFANSFDVHSELYMDSLAYIELERSFGTFNDFQQELIACAMSCGNGWAVLGYNAFLKKYVTTFISGHSRDVMVGLYPLIVLDVHEHAYFRDYLTDKKSWVVGRMRELAWDVIEERFMKAKAIAQVLK